MGTRDHHETAASVSVCLQPEVWWSDDKKKKGCMFCNLETAPSKRLMNETTKKNCAPIPITALVNQSYRSCG